MALRLYQLPNADTALSQGAEFTNPFSLTFDGRTGGSKQVRLFVRNDLSLFYYTAISLTVQDIIGDSIVNRPEDGFVWKLSEGDIQPTQSDWNNIAPANTVTFSDLGSSGLPDTSTFLPFWIYVQVPPGLDVQTFDEVQFVLQGEENLV